MARSSPPQEGIAPARRDHQSDGACARTRSQLLRLRQPQRVALRVLVLLTVYVAWTAFLTMVPELIFGGSWDLSFSRVRGGFEAMGGIVGAQWFMLCLALLELALLALYALLDGGCDGLSPSRGRARATPRCAYAGAALALIFHLSCYGGGSACPSDCFQRRWESRIGPMPGDACRPDNHLGLSGAAPSSLGSIHAVVGSPSRSNHTCHTPQTQTKGTS